MRRNVGGRNPSQSDVEDPSVEVARASPLEVRALSFSKEVKNVQALYLPNNHHASIPTHRESLVSH
jgi:hypothetical protein